MNAVTVIVLVLLAIGVVAAVHHIIHHKSGCSGCLLSSVCRKRQK